MAFTEVPWTTGDTITEAKLDAMVASDVHVREEANYYNLINQAKFSGESSLSTVSFGVYIDGSIVGSLVTSTSESVQADNDVSGLSNGIHVVEIKKSGSSFTDGAAKYRFYKTPDMDYVTFWIKLDSVDGGGNPYTFNFSYFNMIGHREAKGWT